MEWRKEEKKSEFPFVCAFVRLIKHIKVNENAMRDGNGTHEIFNTVFLGRENKVGNRCELLCQGKCKPCYGEKQKKIAVCKVLT